MRLTNYIIILMLILINGAFACSCFPPGTPLEELNKSTAVFSGKVIEINRPELFKTSLDPIKVTFNVSTVWKGPEYKTLTIETARESASCGYNFEEGKEYIVYTRGEDNDLHASLCSRTNLLENSQEDVNVLGEGIKPVSEKQSTFFLKSIWEKIITFALNIL